MWDDVVFNRTLMLKKLFSIVERDQKVVATVGLKDNAPDQDVEAQVLELKNKLQIEEGFVANAFTFFFLLFLDRQ